MVAAHISVCNSQLRTNTWRLRVSNSQMFSHRCQKGVFCALLEKISIFVNFLPCVVVVLCVFLLVYCSVVSAFVPHLEYLFLFVLGSAIVMFLVFVVGDRSALNVEQCAVIQSDCVVIQSDCVVIQPDFVVIQSDCVVFQSDCVVIQLDFVVIQSDCVLIQSDFVVNQTDCVLIQLDCVVIQSDCVLIQSDCVVIQSDCVVCYLFSHGDDSASVSLASRVTTDFELKRKV